MSEPTTTTTREATCPECGSADGVALRDGPALCVPCRLAASDRSLDRTREALGIDPGAPLPQPSEVGARWGR